MLAAVAFVAHLAHFLDASPGVLEIKESACQQPQPSNKFDGSGYEMMYGLFLMPLVRRAQPLKVLEIGLGCDMSYGAGVSARFWRKLMPAAEIWEAEYDGKCVNAHAAEMKRLKINTLIGDQGDPRTLHSWVNKSGGDFDVIIDDGSHTNKAIMASFTVLWEALSDGGLYFIEDLDVGRTPKYDNTQGEAVMADILNAWNAQLMNWGHNPNNFAHRSAPNQRFQMLTAKYKLPHTADFIFCQPMACVIGKRDVRMSRAGIHRSCRSRSTRSRSGRAPQPLPP